jgi:predicted  nucleic acid-binding Zn-ribbon protein
MIRKRLGNAIGWTSEGTCSACNMTLSPMLFQELRRDGRLDQCPHCRRIIYYREPVAVDSEETSNES